MEHPVPYRDDQARFLGQEYESREWFSLEVLPSKGDDHWICEVDKTKLITY
jgi:hypothetical protein